MEDRMLSAREVCTRVGLHRTTIWKKVRAGTFPPPIELCSNKSGWPESSVASWLESRVRRTYSAPVDENDAQPEAASA